jgi:hypothetical protein
LTRFLDANPVSTSLENALAATAALSIRLNRRTGHGPERAEHAAVASQGLKLFSAAFADIEELAGIGRHLLDRLKAAFRTCQKGF